MNLEDLLLYHALKLKLGSAASYGTDPLESADSTTTRQICAKVSPTLYERIDQYCGLLGISKRLFIETAVIEALRMSDDVLRRTGAWESLTQQEDA